MPRLGEYTKATAIAQQFSRIKTGTYTGDGSISQGITGIGFQPKFVWIILVRTSEGNGECFYTLTGMTTGFCQRLASSYTAQGAYDIDDRLISLDADGFTVDDDGSDQHPNKAASSYAYIALG